MAQVLITYKIMPESVDVDLSKHQDEINEKIVEFGGRIAKFEIEEVAFGLKALKIIWTLDETKGDTEELEKKIEELEYVQSVEVVDVRRQFG